MTMSRWMGSVVFAAVAIAFHANAVASEPRVVTTGPQKIGNGSARVYVALNDDGSPRAIGIRLDKDALAGLPMEPNATSRCFDRDGDGRIEPHECIGDYAFVFPIPDETAKAVAPFKWVALNWNPHGHGSPAPPPWAAPHFDFHFYLVPRDAVQRLRTGKCGEMIDCDDFKTATKPVPAKYVHADHIDVGAAVPDMGNHLIDSKSPELAKGGPPFTYTFIFGAYDGKITFLEPMVTLAFIASKPDMCAKINQPAAFEMAGAYPTRYCIRYLAGEDAYAISIEDFVRREAG